MAITKYTHIVGRVGKDATFVAAEGKARTKFTVAVETGYDKDTKSAETTWYDVTAWDDLANAIAVGGTHEILKGARVYVSGRESVWHADSGDRKQISAREIGFADRIRTTSGDVFPKEILFKPITLATTDMMDGVDEEVW